VPGFSVNLNFRTRTNILQLLGAQPGFEKRQIEIVGVVFFFLGVRKRTRVSREDVRTPRIHCARAKG